MNDLRTMDPFGMDTFEDAFRGLMRPWRFEGADRMPQIRVDVHEDDVGYTVRADMPGMKKEDIDVRVDGNLVTLSAETRREHEEKKEGRVIRRERQVGYATRTFSLASDVDEGQADAKYADGVLTLKLPKKAQTSSRKLSIG